MDLNDPMLQRAIYGLAIPAGLGLVIALVALLLKRERLACFAVPVAALIGVAVCFVQPLHAVSEPGSFDTGRDAIAATWQAWTLDAEGSSVDAFSWTRWMWLLPTLLLLLVAWPAALMLPRKAWALPVAAIVIGCVGFVLWPSRFGDTRGQPIAYGFLVPIASTLLAVVLYWAARRRDGGAGDLIGLGIAGMFAVPLIGLAEFHGAVVLFLPIVAATLGSAVVLFLLRGERFTEVRQAVAAGAFVLPIAMLPPALISWYVSFDLGKLNAIPLVIPTVAGTLAVIVPRLPKAWAGVVLSGVVGSIGVALILVVADVSPYVTPPAWLKTWLGEWSYVEPAPERAFDEDAANFWGGS